MDSTMVFGGAAAILVIAGIAVSGSFSGLDFSNNCNWQDVEVNNQTFSSKAEFETAWKGQETDKDWSFVENRLEFRVEGGVLQQRSCPENGDNQ